jgi:PAS domain S-box-containing protein
VFPVNESDRVIAACATATGVRVSTCMTPEASSAICAGRVAPRTGSQSEPHPSATQGGRLSAPQAILARILEDVPQPIWVVDHLDCIVFANPAACHVLGYRDVEELQGKLSHETVHYKRRDGTPYPQAECPMLRPRQTGETVHSDDEWFVRSDGSMFPITWWSAPIDMPGGQGAVFAFTDITERLAAEKALRERGAAEIRAAESQAAQRRILDSATAARRQLARDLHDGAQQRLVALMLELRLARDQIRCPEEDLALLDAPIKHAGAALDELRELATGVHPSILTQRGLPAAIRALARRSPVPVSVSAATPDDRLPEGVEANAYFLIAEALTNAIKHARATRIEVSMHCDGAALVLEIHDDGIGGASTETAGSGIKGMADRARSLGGRFTIVSPQQGGTSVRAAIPVDPIPPSPPAAK